MQMRSESNVIAAYANLLQYTLQQFDTVFQIFDVPGSGLERCCQNRSCQDMHTLELDPRSSSTQFSDKFETSFYLGVP